MGDYSSVANWLFSASVVVKKRHIKEICYTFVYDRNNSCYGHVQYICIGKTIKNDINCCVPLASSPFSSFQGVMCVKQLSVSLMMLKEPQIHKFKLVKMA